jgi:trehalose-6-phosphate synthase
LPGEIEYEEQDWIKYAEVNKAFSQRIAELAQNGDIVWVHDYHLLLVPAMLRGKVSQGMQLRIGLFLHTPFPSSEIFR